MDLTDVPTMVGTQPEFPVMSTEKPLSVAHFTLTDVGGGAAGAVARLHRALSTHGIDSRLHVAHKGTSDSKTLPVVRGAHAAQALTWSRRLDLLPLWLRHPYCKTYWSPGWHGMRDISTWPSVMSADVLGLYWLPRGFMGIRQVERLLKLGKPVVWRLSDMWPFTGGCHYSGQCEAYSNGCGCCPQLHSNRKNDLSHRLHYRKQKSWNVDNLTVVSPSRWMAEAARRSPIFAERDIRVIATGIDTNIFRPIDRNKARLACDLPMDTPLVLFGADSAMHDPRKGGSAVISVMQKLASTEKHAPPSLVLFGTRSRPDGIPESVPVHVMGTISNERAMASLFSACDVFLAPSKQENLANTVLESMACGTPVVAYGIGGMSEAIENGSTGLLTNPKNDDELANAASMLLADNSLRTAMGSRARLRATTKYDLHTQAKKYIDLYLEKVSAKNT